MAWDKTLKEGNCHKKQAEETIQNIKSIIAEAYGLGEAKVPKQPPQETGPDTSCKTTLSLSPAAKNLRRRAFAGP